MSPELQVHTPWADLVSFSTGGRAVSLALVSSMPDAQRRRSCAGAGQAIVYPYGEGELWKLFRLCRWGRSSSAGFVGSPLMLPRDAQSPWRCLHPRRPLAGF